MDRMKFYRIKELIPTDAPQFAWLNNEQAMGYGDPEEQIEVWTDLTELGGPMVDTSMARHLFEVIEES